MTTVAPHAAGTAEPTVVDVSLPRTRKKRTVNFPWVNYRKEGRADHQGRASLITPIEQQTMKKVYLRLLPFCFILYFICYLDRVNVGFAALTMNKVLGLSSYVFGLGAGAFFWGYFILEVPSNLILERVGARRWIARVMVSWGLVSGAFAFINGPTSFFILRFFLALPKRAFSPA